MVQCPGLAHPLRGSGMTLGQSTKTLTATLLRRKGRKKTKQNKTKTPPKKTKTEKRKCRTLGKMVKANLYRQNHTKKHIHTHSQEEKNEKKYIYIKEESNQTNKQIHQW